MEYLGTLILIAIGAAIINNFVLHYFVGLCSYVGVSRRIDMAVGMGFAVIFVICIATLLSWASVTFLLQPGAPVPTWVWHQIAPASTAVVDLSILSYIVFILVIAASVQLVEMYVRKFFPSLYKAFGVYLPLITVNCAILFACIYVLNKIKGVPAGQQWGLGESLTLAFFAGAGYMLAIVIMAGIREELEFSDVPKAVKGAPITLITAGILAMAFAGFARVDVNLEKAFHSGAVKQAAAAVTGANEKAAETSATPEEGPSQEGAAEGSHAAAAAGPAVKAATVEPKAAEKAQTSATPEEETPDNTIEGRNTYLPASVPASEPAKAAKENKVRATATEDKPAQTSATPNEEDPTEGGK